MMFAMLEEKFPPPKPPAAAASANTQYGVSGFITAKPRMVVGMRSRSALTIVQLRPPKICTAKV